MPERSSLDSQEPCEGKRMDNTQRLSTSYAEYLLNNLPDDVLARILTYVPCHIGLSINRRCRLLTLRHVCSVAPRVECQHASASTSSQEGQATDPLDPHINDNSLVGILDTLQECPSLHTVKLLYLTTQFNIAALTELPQIRELEIGTISASHLPSLGLLAQLTALSIANCRGIATLDFVSGLRSLQDLTLSHAHSLESFEGLLGAKMLRVLHLKSLWQTVPSLTSLVGCTGLQRLTLNCMSGCRQLQDVTPVAQLTQLSYLAVQNAKGVNGIEAIQQLTRLRELCLQELGDALHPALPSLSALHHLTNLSVSWCRPASSLKVLSSLTSLKSLMISKWPFATNADCLGQLTQLTSLRLCDMYNLALKDHLSSLAALQELTVLECGSKTMTSFLWASRITGLQSLQVDVRGRVEGISALLASKASLKHLRITNCHAYAARPMAMVLGELTALTNLCITGPELHSGVFQLP